MQSLYDKLQRGSEKISAPSDIIELKDCLKQINSLALACGAVIPEITSLAEKATQSFEMQ